MKSFWIGVAIGVALVAAFALGVVVMEYFDPTMPPVHHQDGGK